MAKYAGTDRALQLLTPYFFNDLKFIRQPEVEQRIIQGVTKAVYLGEEKFQQAFGGWFPASNEFGITTLRPHHLDVSSTSLTSGSNRWLWTSGSTATIDWAAEDSFVNVTLDDDEIAVIYGYFNLEAVPNLIEMWIQPGNVKLPLMNLQPMRIKSEPYLIFPEPLVIEPRSPLVVKVSTINTSTAEEAGFLGYFIAPASTLLEKT